MVAARSKARSIFARSNTGIVDSNPTWGMDVSVHLCCVCAVLCVQVEALQQADPPQRSPTDCVKHEETEKRPSSNKWPQSYIYVDR
jgi:hypothetical protein